MGDATSISWTDATWNPIRGCSRVSPGCVHCYAERVAGRFSGQGQPYEGLVKLVKRTHEKVSLSKTSAKYSKTSTTEARWNGVVRLIPEHLADPLRWRKPRRIFVNSMSDLFHEALSNEQIAAVFGVMAAAPRHTFQVLTKRPERMRQWFEWIGQQPEPPVRAMNAALDVLEGVRMSVNSQRWPLPNVWLGVSVENQAAADERIPLLLDTPAAVRFLSCEPLLGPVVLPAHEQSMGSSHSPLDWVIAGCESGPGARPCDTDWLRRLRDQCEEGAVPFFLKQAVPPRGSMATGQAKPYAIDKGRGSKVKQGFVIELPYLDGVQHAAFPKETP
jgi:protein gp37